MDLSGIIAELQTRVAELDVAIKKLEQLQSSGSPPGTRRRGRKCMGAEERLQVSARMRQYWDGRRNSTP